MAATTQAEENKRIARLVPEEVATNGAFDLIDDICTDDVVDHSPFGEVEGRGGWKRQLEEMREAVPDFSATVEDIVAEGDTVAMRVTLRGTQEGEIFGIPPTGKSFEVTNAVFTRFEDERIAERWVLPDMLGMMTQLGVVDLPSE